MIKIQVTDEDDLVVVLDPTDPRLPLKLVFDQEWDGWLDRKHVLQLIGALNHGLYLSNPS